MSGDVLCPSEVIVFCSFFPFSCSPVVSLMSKKIVWYFTVVFQEEYPRQQASMMNVSV